MLFDQASNPDSLSLPLGHIVFQNVLTGRASPYISYMCLKASEFENEHSWGSSQLLPRNYFAIDQGHRASGSPNSSFSHESLIPMPFFFVSFPYYTASLCVISANRLQVGSVVRTGQVSLHLVIGDLSSQLPFSRGGELVNSLKTVFYVPTSDKCSFGEMNDTALIGTQSWCLIFSILLTT